jgi:glycosyltransferase involved in cell wall biosynthesis
LIALTDAGIRLDPHWLQELLAVLERQPEVQVVYGHCEPVTASFFEHCAALAYMPPYQDRPGGRIRGSFTVSMLLRRDVWRDLGGFPDRRAAEDLIFMERIEQHGYKVSWAPAAIVHWQLQPTLARTFRRFALYSKHNVWAGRQRYWHYGVARQYLLALPFLALALVHSPWWLTVPLAGALVRVAKTIWVRREGRGPGFLFNPAQFACVALILVTIDLATFLGWLQALWQRPLGNPTRSTMATPPPMTPSGSRCTDRHLGNRRRLPAPSMSALYLCYQAISDPLTQTQVVAYLEGLARAGYAMILLTFEPRALRADEANAWRERLRAKGITWYWCRYHKRPTVPATAYDVLVGVLMGLWLVRRHRVRLLHARVHVPGLMALMLKWLTGAKLLFDIRGFMAEEYVDAGVWKPNGLLFRMTKRVERALVRKADGLVTLTQKGREALKQWYPEEIAGKPLEVIPCCVDFRQIPEWGPDEEPRQKETVPPRLVYVGKLGGTYPVEEMTAFFSVARRMIPGLRWEVWTQSNASPLRSLVESYGLGHCVTVGLCSPDQLVQRIRGARAALCLFKRQQSGFASSPTKAGEYLAAGVPVVCSAGVGDMDALLGPESNNNRVQAGVLVREMSQYAYQEAVLKLISLFRDPATTSRCRKVAAEHLHLEGVGWARYVCLYRELSKS